MTVQNIYDLVNYVVGKELIGNAFTVPQFNLLLPFVQDEIKSEQFDNLLKLKENQKALSDYISTCMIRPFVTGKNITVSQTTGIGVIPTDFERFISCFATYKGNIRYVDMVSDEVFNKRRGSVNYRPDVHPFGKFENDQIYFIPYDLGQNPNADPLADSSIGVQQLNLRLIYLRKTTTPFLDFCQDATSFESIFIQVGSTIVDAGDGTGNMTWDDPVNGISWLVRSNIYLDPAKVYPYTSLSVELEFEEWTHIKFVSRLLSKVGLNLGEDRIVQAMESLKKEGK